MGDMNTCCYILLLAAIKRTPEHMMLFRIDKRDFNVNDKILPQNAYQNELDDSRKKVEEVLEFNRPKHKPKRNEILMLFENFEDAKHFWTIQKNSKFYRGEISETEIFHIGDFNKIEELFKNISDTKIANKIAKEYWNSEMTENPKKEIFVNEVITDKVMSDSEIERKNAFAIRAGLGNPKIKIILNN
ncbi:hypothetical protein SAMN05660866_03750 [Maribacter arcticus]|uniref:Uncharacterized protein n=1 Tax=Maribacter arcticus TaxID=561365 RepID=A0A1T5EX12_9FLAO|nr:hypothetical protein SAMN05660866_03750 [Maribacter arcticus]